MAKLVEILARELNEWPEGAQILVQDIDSEGKFGDSACIGSSHVIWERVRPHSSIYLSELADDWNAVKVTRAQWEVERARIAANQQATAEAREIANGGYAGSAPVSCLEGEEVFIPSREEQELVNIACGKRSKEDQALWDKVASEIFTSACDESIASYRPEEVEYVAVRACTYADAFMAERAKRMKD